MAFKPPKGPKAGRMYGTKAGKAFPRKRAKVPGAPAKAPKRGGTVMPRRKVRKKPVGATRPIKRR